MKFSNQLHQLEDFGQLPKRQLKMLISLEKHGTAP